ncbi:MAG TPA: Wzz/FepE/Etk N-terminal domain-containing protein, partial [Lacipirellulaceae bacterium]|nr:Wzz/FepE/Etk N-terminal domain-containing protein [Lacipirellulaceae bacterium]
MEPAVPPAYTPRELVDLLWSRRRIWIATAGTAAVLAAVGSLVIPRQWEASQGLLVRQETAGAAGSRPGKFADLYEMRTLQETILEVAKSQQVVAATLRAVDRDLGGSGAPP